MRKFKEVKRKEIIYSLSEWKQIERAAAKVSMQTSEYIRRMSLNGEVTYLNMEGVTLYQRSLRLSIETTFILLENLKAKLKSLLPNAKAQGWR